MAEDKGTSSADQPIVYHENFEDGPGGWFTWDGGLKKLEIRDGAVVSRSPWWVDPNHAPPGAGYLHLLMAIYTSKPGGDALLQTGGPNRLVARGFPTDYTNAKVTLRIKGNLDLKGASLVFLAQSTVDGKAINSVLAAQPIHVTPEWSTQTITLVPDDSQWICLGSRHNRTESYGWAPIAPVLKDLNLDIILVLFPLDVQPEGSFAGDKDRVYPDRDYNVDRSRLPSGEVWIDDIRIEFAAR